MPTARVPAGEHCDNAFHTTEPRGSDYVQYRKTVGLS
jgi:hypothetical protein